MKIALIPFEENTDSAMHAILKILYSETIRLNNLI